MAISKDLPRIVVVDDERVILESWKEILGDQYEVVLFSDAVAARTYFEDNEIDVALLDIRMPGIDGLTLLNDLRRLQPDTEVIVITGHGTIQTAVLAIQSGAYDFLCKPIEDLDIAVRRVDGAVERRRMRLLNNTLRKRLDALSPSTTMIGGSRALHRVRDLINQIADSTAPVLICGESGTGKELAARALHSQSNRSNAPFVAVNCGAMTETLIDSELFGHERGAFTGAIASHRGLFEAANTGVLFLDEIGDIPMQTQVRLLRVLQENEVRPVGAVKSRSVNVRVIAATNIDLERAIHEGRFREDLFYRISTFRMELPPLRERREDIPLIAQFLLDKIAQKSNLDVHGFTDEALAALVKYSWQGNVRELNNAIEHAATLCNSDRIDVADLPSFVSAGGSHTKRRATIVADSPTIGSVSSAPYSTARARLLEDFEQRYLADLLATTDGNLSEAARRSGIDRSNLRRMLKRYHISAHGFKNDIEG
ncbi:MAG: sigma-54-dependent Fis family transcriptional regulator [Deltaproteobacteria bacterium]|nr:sigma-54-dependent Fis family transcriptional regulator [Deltaproteobacteria bacterium]